METTVTGLFADAAGAAHARQKLEDDGFSPDAISLLTKDTANLHNLLDEETSDAARGAMVGGVLGGCGMALASAVMTMPPMSVFDMHWLLAALLGGAIGAIVAALIGFGIGSATGHMVQQEYEAMIHSGGQLLAVNTDSSHAGQAFETLRRLGGSALSTSVHLKHHTEQSA